MGPSGLNAGYYQFRANSVYDPNLTGVGHQPMGHDQLAALYDKYRVYNAKIVLTAACNTGYAALLAIRPHAGLNAYSGAATPDELWEQDGVVSTRLIGPSTAAVYSAGKLGASCNVARIFGVTAASHRADDYFAATVGNNPQNQAIFNILLRTIDGGAATFNCFVTVEITYDVEFYDQKTLGQS